MNKQVRLTGGGGKAKSLALSWKRQTPKRRISP